MKTITLYKDNNINNSFTISYVKLYNKFIKSNNFESFCKGTFDIKRAVSMFIAFDEKCSIDNKDLEEFQVYCEQRWSRW